MPPKKENTKKEEKLDGLINKLEERLAIFNESELKKVCLKTLVEMNKTIEELTEQHRHFYEILGLTWGEINYE